MYEMDPQDAKPSSRMKAQNSEVFGGKKAVDADKMRSIGRNLQRNFAQFIAQMWGTSPG
jgi:hypothetical protein